MLLLESIKPSSSVRLNTGPNSRYLGQFLGRKRMDDHKVQNVGSGGREGEQDKMEFASDSPDRVIMNPVSLDDAQWRAKSNVDFVRLQSAFTPALDIKAMQAAVMT
ncbi:hypothetical protein PFWH6_1196, partial [Pseudomonas fluorescens WH6]